MPSYIQNNPESKIQSRSAALPDSIGPAELGLVVDRSGSMQPVASSLITSFNTLLDDQKALADAGGIPPRVSLSLFSDCVQKIYDAVPAAEVSPLSSSTYVTNGGTALNDAIGSMIGQIGKHAKRSTRVLITTLTDGGENSSTSFSTDDVLHMISYRRLNYDWQFIFIGPPFATDYALKIGIPHSNIVQLDPDPSSLREVMVRLSKSVRAYQLGDRKYALKLHN